VNPVFSYVAPPQGGVFVAPASAGVSSPTHTHDHALECMTMRNIVVCTEGIGVDHA